MTPCHSAKEERASGLCHGRGRQHSSAADARRTIRRGHARFKQPGFPAGKAGKAGPAPGSSPRGRRAARTERRALLTQSVSGLQGRRPAVARAARGRCGPRLRPRPGCGGLGAVPGHRWAAGAPALIQPTPSRVGSFEEVQKLYLSI
ncbi:hypothetical protein MC885_011920 [Smutsia gigantea]|nr:hypothetical protein MC885_011920 [Smutsia gigantea]